MLVVCLFGTVGAWKFKQVKDDTYIGQNDLGERFNLCCSHLLCCISCFIQKISYVTINFCSIYILWPVYILRLEHLIWFQVEWYIKRFLFFLNQKKILFLLVKKRHFMIYGPPSKKVIKSYALFGKKKYINFYSSKLMVEYIYYWQLVQPKRKLSHFET